MSKIFCNNCNKQHIDKEKFATFPHRKHLCEYCGKYFFDTKRDIGD